MSKRSDTYLVTKDQFFGNEFADFVLQKRANGEDVCVTIILTKKFDEWEIEKYVKKFAELHVDEIVIKISEVSIDKPYYKQIKEVNGALHHFANFVESDKEKEYQEFEFNGTRIIYEYCPK